MNIALVQIDLVLGARLLLSLLEQDGHNVQLLQVNIKYTDILSDESLDAIYNHISSAEVIGLSFNSFYALQGERLARYFKSRSEKHTIICGGYHATAMPESVVEYSDIVILYEAEKALPHVIHSLGDMAAIEKTQGVLTKNKRGKEHHRSPELVTDLDSLPLQPIDTSAIMFYSIENGLYAPNKTSTFTNSAPIYYILGSRGCPFSCTYCSNSLFHALDKQTRKVRKRSVENIIKEMKYAVSNGFEAFYIADDNFFSFSIEEIELFSVLYKEISKPFSVVGVNPNNFRSNSAERKLQLLLGCGLSDVRIGVQSGCNETLRRFDRGYKAEEISALLLPIDRNRETIFPAPKNKLHVALDFICDSPWESVADKHETVRLANAVLEQFTIFFYTLVHLPGTKLYEDALRNGQIQDHVKDIFQKGIAGVEDNPSNRLLFLIGVLKERGASLDPDLLEHLLRLSQENLELFLSTVDCLIAIVNSVENHHGVDLEHGAIHPYLTGFNAWTKQTGQVGKKVLFRSYHQAYG